MKHPIRILAAALTLWALVYAHPAFAGTFHSAAPKAAGVSTCEGCESAAPVVELAVEGQNNVARVEGLVLTDMDFGIWTGIGHVDYEGFGVSIHEPAASFRVTFAPSPCKDCLVDRFPASIDAYAPDGHWILSVAKLRFLTDTPDPVGVYDACAIGDLPASFRIMRPKLPPSGIQSLGSVKAGYVITPSGRMLRKPQ